MPENKTKGEQSSRTTGEKNNRRTVDSSSSRHNGLTAEVKGKKPIYTGLRRHVHQMGGNNSSKKQSSKNNRKGIPQKNHIEMENTKNIVYRQRQRIRKQNHGEVNAKLRNTTFENTTIKENGMKIWKTYNSR